MSQKLLCLFQGCQDNGNRLNYLIYVHIHSLIFLDPSDELLNNIVQGNWNENIDSNNEKFQNFLKTGEGQLTNDEKLKYSISCLLTYAEENFSGSSSRMKSKFEIADSADLLINGIEINVNMVKIECLLIARRFLEELMKNCPDDIVRN